MKLVTILRTVLIAMFAAAAALPGMNASAAIPCQELPVIEPDPNMAIPMIYIELPVTVEGALSRGQAADRADATELDGETASSVRMAAQNQFRCLNYGNDVVFAGNSTPQQRVNMWAVPAIDANETYIEVDSLYLERLGDPIALADGRYLIDFGIIVDGDTYLTGELVFTEEADGLYLDGSALDSDVEFLDEPVTLELSTRFTREVKIINVSNGDKLVFKNIEEEASAAIVITNPAGETIFEGSAPAIRMVGGEPTHIYVIHNLEPGEYQITVTFSPDQIVYGATLVVEESDAATPVASPEASPAS